MEKKISTKRHPNVEKLFKINIIILTLFIVLLSVPHVHGWAVIPTHPELTEEAFDTLEQSGACTLPPHYKFVVSAASRVSHARLMEEVQ